MPFLNRVFLLLFFLFLPVLVAGQYLPSTNYSTKDGLPNNAVRSLFIDSDNVLWVGTENGVAKLENGAFTIIDESDGLGHNSCWDIAQDANGNMWFASYGGGVSKYDGKKFTIFTTKNGLLANKTRKVFPFKDKIYVGTEQGVSIIDINTNKVETPIVPPHKEDFISISFFTYKGEVYFASIFDGIYKIEESRPKPSIKSILRHKKLYCLGLFGSTLFSSNEGFIDQYNIDKLLKGDFNSKSFGMSMVWQYAQDKRNSIFAAAWGVYKPDGGLYKINNNMMLDVSQYYGIDSKTILNVVYDKSKDLLYVGSNDKGIYEIRLDGIIKYNSFSSNAVIDFDWLDNKKFILHNYGVSILKGNEEDSKLISQNDFKNFEIKFLKNGNDVNRKQGTESRDFELDYSIPAKGIQFYELVKNKNSLWVGTNIGIFELTAEGKIINYVPKHSLKIGFTYNGKFIETITYAGTRLYDDVHKSSSKHFSKFEKNTPQYIVKILTNRDKTYLLSVFNGLYVYKNNQFHSYLAEGIWKENKFKHITVNSKGQLILAAEFGNVFIVDDSNKFKVLKTIYKKQIVGNTILFLESYKDFILIGTERGINIYKDGIIRLIDKEQGLKDEAVTTSQIFENTLWLGTKKGYYTINLDFALASQKTVSSIAISKITINNEPIKSTNYSWFKYNSKELHCDYKHNSFSIDFVPKGHAFPNKLKFRYRLNTANRWSPYSEKTNLFLPYLPFGKYNVEVQVYDLNAGKTTTFKLLTIQIDAPLWLRWWFIALVALVAFNIIVYLIFKSKRKSRERAVVQKRIAETKLEALLSQMNPHFTFNAINAIQDYIISNDIDNSLKYTGEFAKLIRKTLENSSKQTITIEEEIEYLKSYITIENMRFDNRIDAEFQIGEDVDIHHYKIPTMLLQPFVENVFVHAFNASFENPKLTIVFEMLSNTVLECRIIDNGMSLKATKRTKIYKSKGIELTKERLSLLQSLNLNPIDIQLTDNNGTTVIIRLAV